jgi:very-short-patch-repair endonuclease
VAALAERQHGVVSISQLRSLGLTSGAIEWRLRRRRLQRLYRGVFAVGHGRLSFRGKLWAAVLACGGPQVAALSHRTAAAVWDLLPAPAGPIDVTTLRAGHSTTAIRVHRSRALDAIRQPDGLPVTSVARTLLDLARVLSPHRLDRLCHRSQFLGLLDAAEADALIAEIAHRPGSGRLRIALNRLAITEPQTTRSELEERFLALIAENRLPRPKVNAQAAGHEVDFLWPHHHLIAETDGAAAHLNPLAFEQDRHRDAALLIAGFRVVRFTWAEVIKRPHSVASTMRALLSGARPARTPASP